MICPVCAGFEPYFFFVSLWVLGSVFNLGVLFHVSRFDEEFKALPRLKKAYVGYCLLAGGVFVTLLMLGEFFAAKVLESDKKRKEKKGRLRVG